MQDRITIRQLYRLANRLEANAALIRNARLPHHLSAPRLRALRHLKELNQIRDTWADHFKPTRVKRPYVPLPLCECQNPSFWRKRRLAFR